MKIGLIVDPYGEKNPGGLGRAIFEIVKALVELDRTNTYTLYFKKKPEHPPNIAGKHWTYNGLESKKLWLTGALGTNRTLDIYIFFTPIIPFFLKPKRSIVVAFDFAYWRLRKSLSEEIRARFLFFLHRRALRLANVVVAVSEETKQDVIKFFGVPAERIIVIDLSYVPLGEEKEDLPVPEKFFLFAGVLKERKNVAGVIKAFALFAKNNLNHQLLIAGKQGGEYAESLQKLVHEFGIEDRVRFLGYVTNAQLAYLYGMAEALVFPSFIEGFGMPVLEAMHAGLPVITSNKGALAEVAGDASLLVDPARPKDIAVAMERIAMSPTVGKELREKGLVRVAQFSWQKTAQGILEILIRVVHTEPKL